MLMLLFYLGDILCTIKCEKVREIAPLVNLKTVRHAPDYFAGYFNYRGLIVPVIDLRQFIYGHPCHKRLSTRIILANYQKKDSFSIIGFMAERVTETVMKPQDAVLTMSMNIRKAPYLGNLVIEEKEMIQYIDLEKLPPKLDCLSIPEDGDSNAAEVD